LGVGDVIGGLGMLGGEPRTDALVAVDHGTLLALSRTDFDQVLTTLPSLKSTVTDMVAQHLFASAQRRDRVDPSECHAAKSSSPFAIFIGTLQDGIPESLAIGASFTSLAAFNPTFLVAVLLSNLPEAVAGTVALRKVGFSSPSICLMWLGLVVGSMIAGSLGCALLYGASPAIVAFLGALAGGGVVAMLATTMMPEAYETGRSGVVPATIAGFLASLLLSILELEAR
jgi:zinc transporter ZupT